MSTGRPRARATCTPRGRCDLERGKLERGDGVTPRTTPRSVRAGCRHTMPDQAACECAAAGHQWNGSETPSYVRN